MNNRYLTLFALRVSHEYYGGDDAPCPDFDFVLAQHSQRALAGARLLASVSDGLLRVLFDADDNDCPMQDIAGMELVIGLRLRNPYFEHFTDALPAPLPLYANATTPKTLDTPQACDLVATRFEPVAALTQRPLMLCIYRMRNNALIWSVQSRTAMACNRHTFQEPSSLSHPPTWNPAGCCTLPNLAEAGM
jgi:hypothetical protein